MVSDICMTTHPLYNALGNISSIQIFMENHVFSVWLFMCLLQSLVYRLTGSILWNSPHDYNILKVLRSIMFEEEMDTISDASLISHLDMYIRGMEEVGASTVDIMNTLERVRNQQTIDTDFIQNLTIEDNTKDYIMSHLDILSNKTSFSSMYSYFTYGREVIIPGMFQKILNSVQNLTSSCPIFIEYLERHIELDVSHAQELQAVFPFRDELFIERALVDRTHLWDGIYEKIVHTKTCNA